MRVGELCHVCATVLGGHSFSWLKSLLLVTAVLASTTTATKTPPGYPPSPKIKGCLPKQPGSIDIFCPGDEGYGCYKIPTLLQTRNGTLLGMIEARKFSCDDKGYVDLRVRRSHDNGTTWGPSLLVHGNSTDNGTWTTVGDAMMVQDPTTGIIFLLHTRNNTLLYLSRSNNEGVTWSAPRDVTATLKYGGMEGWIGSGHAGAIVLSSGPHLGRLIMPMYSIAPYSIYSDDHGNTWHMGAAVSLPLKIMGGENQIAETGFFTKDGTPILLISIRNSPKVPVIISGKGYRLQALSHDGGITWSISTENRQLFEPISGCEGSLVYHPGVRKLFFSHPDPPLELFRTNLRVWSSSNMGSTWEHHAIVWKQAAGYSALTPIGKDQLGVLYDRNNHTMVVFEAQSVTFTVISAD